MARITDWGLSQFSWTNGYPLKISADPAKRSSVLEIPSRSQHSNNLAMTLRQHSCMNASMPQQINASTNAHSQQCSKEANKQLST